MASHTVVGSRELAAAVRKARERGEHWLASHIADDGRPEGDQAIFTARLPLALAYCGRYDLGEAVLTWFGRNESEELLRGDGQRYGSYYLALLAQGAAQLGRYDRATRLAGELLAWESSCGAPWSRRREGCGEVEWVPACQAGITLLACNQPAAALRIADYVVDVWRQQPAPGERLYLITDGNGALITPADAGDEHAYYVLEREKELQHFFAGGIAAAFLVQAFWVSNDERYLDTARRYFGFAIGQPHQFGAYQCCKTAWGAAYLSVATADREPEQWLVHMAEWFIEHQDSDGAWRDPNFSAGISGDILITGEFVQHLTMILWGLGHRSGS